MSNKTSSPPRPQATVCLASLPSPASLLSLPPISSLNPQHHSCPAPADLAPHSDITRKALDLARAFPGQRFWAGEAGPAQQPTAPFSRSQPQPLLKEQHNRCLAPSGLGMFLNVEPRALPWADIFRPFGAAEGGLGYGG